LSQVRQHPSKAQIHTIAAHRDTLLNEQRALLPSLREATVGADDPMPWKAFVGRRKNAADEARRDGVDIAIGADEPGGDRPHPRDDAIVAWPKAGSVPLTPVARIGPDCSTHHSLERTLRHSAR
jgi:hypothetical protein